MPAKDRGPGCRNAARRRSSRANTKAHTPPATQRAAERQRPTSFKRLGPAADPVRAAAEAAARRPHRARPPPRCHRRTSAARRASSFRRRGASRSKSPVTSPRRATSTRCPIKATPPLRPSRFAVGSVRPGSLRWRASGRSSGTSTHLVEAVRNLTQQAHHREKADQQASRADSSSDQDDRALPVVRVSPLRAARRPFRCWRKGRASRPTRRRDAKQEAERCEQARFITAAVRQGVARGVQRCAPALLRALFFESIWLPQRRSWRAD